ncbi:flagellar hook-length control protein FliK [Stieleria varia]|uniref:flagellar hook-length control protein FliK n=1 Tax=Stieleria varia TaxID=2528005 RepID=UPI0018D23F2A|nr:flagellar hook-length control protein FliK [Stieleria varia]
MPNVSSLLSLLRSTTDATPTAKSEEETLTSFADLLASVSNQIVSTQEGEIATDAETDVYEAVGLVDATLTSPSVGTADLLKSSPDVGWTESLNYAGTSIDVVQGSNSQESSETGPPRVGQQTAGTDTSVNPEIATEVVSPSSPGPPRDRGLEDKGIESHLIPQVAQQQNQITLPEEQGTGESIQPMTERENVLANDSSVTKPRSQSTEVSAKSPSQPLIRESFQPQPLKTQSLHSERQSNDDQSVAAATGPAISSPAVTGQSDFLVANELHATTMTTGSSALTADAVVGTENITATASNGSHRDGSTIDLESTEIQNAESELNIGEANDASGNDANSSDSSLHEPISHELSSYDANLVVQSSTEFEADNSNPSSTNEDESENADAESVESERTRFDVKDREAGDVQPGDETVVSNQNGSASAQIHHPSGESQNIRGAQGELDIVPTEDSWSKADLDVRLGDGQSLATKVDVIARPNTYYAVQDSPSPAHSTHLTNQVIAVVGGLAESAQQDGPQSVSLELNPEELGHLTIRVEQHGDVISTHIIASEIASSELLMSQRDLLLETLSGLGFEDVNVDISHGQGERAGQDGRPQSNGSTHRATKRTVGTPPPDSLPVSAGLNIIA